MNESITACMDSYGVDPLMKYIFRLLAEGHIAFNFDDDSGSLDYTFPAVFSEGAD